jgi:hypothetical protein
MASATDLVPWFQMGTTVLTGIGVIVSTSLGIVSLQNNRRERIAKIQPNLLFNIGGQEIRASIAPLKDIPGKDPDDPEIRTFLSGRPSGSQCLILQGSFGKLFNHGAGTALDVSIWFEAETVRYTDHERALTRNQQSSPPYTKDWNLIPGTPTNIPPGAEASFYILPASAYLAETYASMLSGKTHIECRDAEGNPYEWRQPTRFFIERPDASGALVTISFEQRPS